MTVLEKLSQAGSRCCGHWQAWVAGVNSWDAHHMVLAESNPPALPCMACYVLSWALSMLSWAFSMLRHHVLSRPMHYSRGRHKAIPR